MKSILKPLLALTILGLQISLVVYLLTANHFQVSAITCQTYTNQPCTSLVTKEISTAYQGAIWFIPRQHIENQARNLPTVSHASLSVTLPNQAALITYPVAPIARLQLPEEQVLITTAYQLQPLTQDGNTSLPLIKNYMTRSLQTDNIHQDPVLSFVVTTLQQLTESGLQVTVAQIMAPHQIILTFDQNQTAYISSRQEINKQVTALQLILSRDKIDYDQWKIDVRFKNPVLKPNNPT